MNTKAKRAVNRSFVGLREYARHRGCSPGAVVKAIAEGRIVRRPDGKIDVADADKRWAANSRPRLGLVERTDSAPISYLRARARAMAAEASLKEIALAKERGELVNVDEMGDIWEDALGSMREKMLASVSANAPKIIGLKTIAQAHVALQEIVHAALREASKVAEEIEAKG